jgi:putative ABC transport system substrate-binding protein
MARHSKTGRTCRGTAGTDPATNDLQQNIARPEGNTAGFTSTVDSLRGKWLELLKEAAPHITRAALVFNPQTVNVGYFRPIEAAASRLGMQALKTAVRDPLETVRAIDAFAAEPNGGLLARRNLRRPPAARRQGERAAGAQV